jgi:hypothetical protein
MSEVASGFVVERLPCERQPLPSSSLTCYHLKCQKLHLRHGEKATCLAVSCDCCIALSGLQLSGLPVCLAALSVKKLAFGSTAADLCLSRNINT